MNRDKKFIVNMSSILGEGYKERKITVYNLLSELYGDCSKFISTNEKQEEDKDLNCKIDELSRELLLLRHKYDGKIIQDDVCLMNYLKMRTASILEGYNIELITNTKLLLFYYLIEDILSVEDFKEGVGSLLNGNKDAIVTYEEWWSAIKLRGAVINLFSCLQSLRKMQYEISILSGIKKEIKPILEYFYNDKIEKIRDLVYSYLSKDESELKNFKIEAREILNSSIEEDVNLYNIGRSEPLHLAMSIDKEKTDNNLFGLNVPDGMTLVRVEREDIAIEKIEAIIDEELDYYATIQVTSKHIERAIKMELADLVLLGLGSSFEVYMLRPLIELFYSYIKNERKDKESIKEEAKKIIRTPLEILTRMSIEEESIDETSKIERNSCTEDNSSIDEIRKILGKQEGSERISKILTANRLIELGIRRELVFNRLGLSRNSFDDIKEESDELLATTLYDLGFSEDKIEEILGVQGEEFEEEE